MLQAGGQYARRAAWLHLRRDAAGAAVCAHRASSGPRLTSGRLVPHRQLSVLPRHDATQACSTPTALRGRDIDGRAYFYAGSVPRGAPRASVGGGRAQVASLATCTRTALQSDSARSIESTYQKMSPIEHVLLRPGMYVGGTKEVATDAWCFRAKGQGDAASPHMMHARLRAIPGLLKLFDEILVNAVDHKQRDKSVSAIEVTITQGTKSSPPVISVYNDGSGIPVRKHKGEGVYVPELVLGHLLTGSNFNDDEQRLTGGTYGYGAKLTNILSTDFHVETLDARARKLYRQSWSDNMGSVGTPDITPVPDKPATGFTRVTFSPDLKRFGITNGKLPAGTLELMRRRVVDIAGCIHLLAGANNPVVVKLNGRVVPVGSFQDYVDLFPTGNADEDEATSASSSDSDAVASQRSAGPGVVVARINKQLEIGAALVDPVASAQSSSVSFVNGIATHQGGTHVDTVRDLLTKKLVTIINKRNPGLEARPALVRSHIRVFVNCLVPNPAFDSQSKERLATPVEALGFNVRVTDAFAAAVADAGVEDSVVEALRQKDKAWITRKVKRGADKKLRAIPKLEDANHAGGKHSSKCTLILTEGDSAKALAVAGLAVVGRDRFGVFPLRGKLLNVRDVAMRTALGNEEVAALITILGLDMHASYDGVAPEDRGLRYGRVMIMTDQDHDGFHIKGLLVNLFHTFWPALLREGDFLEQFVTPLIKARRVGGKRKRASAPGSADPDANSDVKQFFGVQEFQAWWDQVTARGEAAKWRIKYYKGLGTSTAEEGREYFSNLARHHRTFSWSSKKDDDVIEMAFAKQHVARRKEWLSASAAAPELPDFTTGDVSYKDFVNKELIQFSRADLVRSIPSAVDGLKPSQRKVLFACFKRGLTQEIKVAQLAGYVAEHTGYHHGEAALHATIINMAQSFVGSNNVPLLQDRGQFGTRLQGGKDAASARYIFTKLSPLARHLFPEADDELLERLEDDGELVEPRSFVPIVPLVLVNGAEGIGTGWSTYVPSHNPTQVVDELLHRLGQPPAGRGGGDGSRVLGPNGELVPWYRGFEGGMVPLKNRGFVSYGRVAWEGKQDIRITELPVGRWTDDYKAMLLKTFVDKGLVRKIQEHTTDQSAEFLLRLTPRGVEHLAAVAGVHAGLTAEEAAATHALHREFRLHRNILTTNMHLFDSSGDIKKYDNVGQVFDDFFPVRMALYAARLQWQLVRLEAEALRVSNRARFLQAVVSGELALRDMGRSELEAALAEQGYATAQQLQVLPPVFDVRTATTSARAAGPAGGAGAGANGGGSGDGVGHDDVTRAAATTGTAASPFAYLVNMPMWRLTGESVAASAKQAQSVQRQIEAARRTRAEDVWAAELAALRDVLPGS